MTVSTLQLANAAGLWAMVQIRGLPDRVGLAVTCCVMTESSLKNVTYGDLNPNGTPTTSLGYFQQTAGYGTAQARLDPATALSMFLDGGPQGQPAFLKQTYMFGTLDDLARCIQAVQRSQFADASNYIANMPLAAEILQQVKTLAFSQVRAQIRALNTALLPVSVASTNMSLATQVRT